MIDTRHATMSEEDEDDRVKGSPLPTPTPTHLSLYKRVKFDLSSHTMAMQIPRMRLSDNRSLNSYRMHMFPYTDNNPINYVLSDGIEYMGTLEVTCLSRQELLDKCTQLNMIFGCLKVDRSGGTCLALQFYPPVSMDKTEDGRCLKCFVEAVKIQTMLEDGTVVIE